MHTSRRAVILPILLVILVLVWMYYHFSPDPISPPDTSEPVTHITVVRADVGVTTLPSGFPSDIPVGDIITQSQKEINPEQGSSLYVVRFVSKKDAETLLDIYRDFLLRSGYTLATRTAASIEGHKKNTTLRITIAPSAGNELGVTVNLLVH